LGLYGGIHPLKFGFHWLLASRFPYAIYYRIDSQEVVVRAVLDCRRDQAWIDPESFEEGANQRIKPMTRSAIALLSQSDATTRRQAQKPAAQR
jgi:hypothetical protein